MIERHKLGDEDLLLPGIVPKLSETPGHDALDRARAGRAHRRGARRRWAIRRAADRRAAQAAASVGSLQNVRRSEVHRPKLHHASLRERRRRPRRLPDREAASSPRRPKVELINQLARTGLHKIEVTSFVSPKAVPALADANDVLAGIDRVPGVIYVALVPNVRGVQQRRRRAEEARRAERASSPHRRPTTAPTSTARTSSRSPSCRRW